MKKSLAGALDVASEIIFVAIGRSVHGHGDTAAGILQTAGPFLAGTMVGWVIPIAWRKPYALVPAGVMIWLSTTIVGQIVRLLVGQGSAVPFVFVSLGFFALTMLGWRGLFVLSRLVASKLPCPYGAACDEHLDPRLATDK